MFVSGFIFIFGISISRALAATWPATLSTCSPETLQLSRIHESRLKGDVTATTIVKGPSDTYFVCVSLLQGKGQSDIYCQYIGRKDFLEEKYFYKAASVSGHISSFQVTNRKTSSLLIASVPDGQSILFLCHPKENILKLIVVGNIGEKGVGQHSIVQHKRWAMILSSSSAACLAGNKQQCNSHIPSSQIYQGSLLVTCESDEYGISTAVTGWTNGSDVYIAHALARLDDPASLTLKVFRVANESALSKCQLTSVASTRLDGICGVQSIKILRSWGKYYLMISSSQCKPTPDASKRTPRNLLGIMWNTKTGRFIKDTLTEFPDTAYGSTLATTSASTFVLLGQPDTPSRIYCLTIEPSKGGFVEASNPMSIYGKASVTVVALLHPARGPASGTLGVYNNNNGQVYISLAWEMGRQNFVSVDRLACPGYQVPEVGRPMLPKTDQAYLRQPVNEQPEKLSLTANGTWSIFNHTGKANCSAKLGEKPLPENFPYGSQDINLPEVATPPSPPETVTLLLQNFLQPILPQVNVQNLASGFILPMTGEYRLQQPLLPPAPQVFTTVPRSPLDERYLEDWFDQIDVSDYEEIIPEFVTKAVKVLTQPPSMTSPRLQVKPPPVQGALTSKLTGSLRWLAEDPAPEFSTQSTVKVDMEPGIFVGGGAESRDVALPDDYEELDQSPRFRAQRGRQIPVYNITVQERRTTYAPIPTPALPSRVNATDPTKQEFPEVQPERMVFPPKRYPAEKAPAPILRKPMRPVNMRRIKFGEAIESATPVPTVTKGLEPLPATQFTYRPIKSKSVSQRVNRLRYNDSMSSNRIRYNETLMSHRIQFSNDSQAAQPDLPFSVRPLRKSSKPPSLILLPSKFELKRPESSIAAPFKHAFSQDYEEVVQIVPEDIAHYEDFQPADIPRPPRMFMNHTLGRHVGAAEQIPSQAVNATVHEDLEDVEYHYDDEDFSQHVGVPKPSVRRRHNVTGQGFQRLRHNATLQGPVYEEPAPVYLIPSSSVAPTVALRKKVTKSKSHVTTKGPTKRMRYTDSLPQRRTPSRRLHIDDNFVGLDKLRHTNVSGSDRLSFHDSVRTVDRPGVFPAPVRRNASARSRAKLPLGNQPRYRYGNFTRLPSRIPPTAVPTMYTVLDFFEMSTPGKIESTTMEPGLHINDTATGNDRLLHIENNYAQDGISFGNDTSYLELQLSTAYPPVQLRRNYTSKPVGITRPPRISVGTYLFNYTAKYHRTAAPYLEPNPERLRFDDSRWADDLSRRNETFTRPVAHLTTKPYRLYANATDLQRLNDSGLFDEEVFTVAPVFDRNATLMYKPPTRSPNITVVLPSAQEMTEHDEDYIYDYEEGRVPHNVAGMAKPGLSRRKHMKNYRESRLRHNMSLTDRIRYSDPSSAPERIRFDDVKTVHELPFQLNTSLLSQPAAPASFNQVVPVNETAVSRMRHDDTEAVSDRMKYTNQTYSVNPRLAQDPEVLDLTEYGEIDEVLRLRFEDTLGLSDRIKYHNRTGITMGPHYTDMLSEYPFSSEAPMYSAVDDGKARMRHNDTMVFVDENRYGGTTKAYKPIFNRTLPYASLPPTLPPLVYKPRTNDSRMRIGALDEPQRMSHMDDLSAHEVPAPIASQQFTPVYAPIQQLSLRIDATAETIHRLQHDETLGVLNRTTYDESLDAPEAPGAYIGQPMTGAAVTAPVALIDMTYQPFTNRSAVYSHRLSSAELHTDDVHEVAAPMINTSQSITATAAIPVFRAAPMRYDDTVLTDNRIKHNETLGISSRMVYDQVLEDSEASGPAIEPQRTAIATTSTLLEPSPFAPASNRSRLTTDHTGDQDRLSHMDDLNAHEAAAPFTTHRVQFAPPYGLAATQEPRHNGTAARLRHNITLGFADHPEQSGIPEIAKVFRPAFVPQPPVMVVPSAPSLPLASVIYIPAVNGSIAYSDRLRFHDTAGQDRLSHTDDLSAHEAALPVPVSAVYSDRLRFHDTAGEDRLFHTDDLSAHEAAAPTSAVYDDRLRFHDTTGQARLSHIGDRSAHEAAVPVPVSAVYSDRLRFHNTTGQDRLSHTDDLSSHEAAIPISAVAFVTPASPGGMNSTYKNSSVQRLSNMDDLHVPETAPLLSLNQPPPMRYVPVEIRSRVRHNDSVGVSSRLGHNETFGVAERLTYDQTLEVQEGHSPVPALLPAVQSTAAARLFTDAPDQLKRTDLETIEDGRSDQYPTFQPGVRLVQYVDDGVARLRHNQTLSSDRVQHDEHDFAYIAVNASLSRLPGIQVGLPEIPQLQVGADVHPLDDRLAYHHLSQINHFTLPEQPRDNRLKHDYILAPESDHQEFQPHFPAFIPVLRPGVHHGIPSQYPADRLRFQPFALSDGIRHNHSFGPPERMRYNDDMRVPELPYVAQPQNIRTGFATDYLPSVGLYPIETDAYRQAWQPSTWTLPDDLSPQIPDIDMDTGVTPFYAQNATVSPIAGISAQATPAPMRNVTKHRDLHETDYTDSADYPIEVHRMPRTTPLPQRLRDHPNVIERLQHNESISEQDRLKFQEGFKPDNYSEQLPPYQGIPPNQSALGYVPDRDRLGINVTSWTDNMLPEFSWLPYYPGAYYQNASLPPVLESPKPTYAQVVPSASRLVYSRDDHPTEALRPIPTLPVQQKPIEAYQPVPTIPRITYHDAPIVFDGLRSQYDVPERLRHFESLPVPEILPTVNVTLQRPVLPYIPASIYPELHNESERTYFTEQSKFEGPGLPQPQLTADRMKYSEHSGQPMEHEEARSPHVQNISLSQPQRYPLPTLSAALPHIPSTPFWTNATVASPRHPDFIPPLRNITSTVSAFVPVPLHPVHPGSDQIVPVIPTQNVSMVLPRAQRKFGHSGDFDGAHGMNRLRHNISLEEYHKEPAMPVTQGAPKAVFPNTSYMEAQRHDAPPGTTADTFLLSPQKFSPTNQTFFTELHPIRPTEILPSPTAPLFIGKMNISKITDEDVAQKIRAQQAKPYKHPNKYMLSREAMNDELVESGYDEKAMFVFPPRYAPSMRDHRKMHEHVTRKRPLAQRDPVEGDYEEKDSLLEADVAAESDTDTTYDQLEPESHGADYGDSLQVSAVEKSKKTHSKVKVTVLKQKAGKDGQTDQSGTFDQQEAYPEKSNRLRYYEDDEVENTKELQSSRSKHRKPAKEPTPSAPPTEASNNLTVQVRLKNVVKVIKGGKRAQLPLSPYSTMIVPELVPNPNNLSLPTVNTKIHEVTIHNRSVNAADNVVLNVNAFLGNDSTSTMHSVKVKLVQSNNAPMAEACRNRLRIENSEYVRHVYCYRNSTDVPIKVVVTGGSGAFSFSIIKDFRGVHDGRRFRFEETGGDLYPKVSVRPDVGANDPNYLRPDHEYHVPVRVVDDVCEDSVETFLSISYMCRRSRRFG